MRLLALMLVGLLWGESRADEVHFLVPQYVSMELHQISRINDPYMAPVDRELKYGGAFVTNFHLVEYGNLSLFSNNRLEFEQSKVSGHIRHAGWRYGLGTTYQLSEHQAVSIAKAHYSYHIFEGEREAHFPTWDSFYVELVIWKK